MEDGNAKTFLFSPFAWKDSTLYGIIMPMKKILSVVTIFIGSFLLFGVQPMIGRTLLPAFGGTAAVWVVCLCAFQVMLLGGYFYAHATAEGGYRPVRMKMHLALLVAAALLTALCGWKRAAICAWASAASVPALGVLVAVLLLCGFAYTLLSANSSLVQAVAATGDATDRSVYRLYAVSNIGSFVGLLAYPFVFEPHVTLTMQWYGFAGGIAIYAVSLAALAAGLKKTAATADSAAKPQSADEIGDSRNPVLWLLLPASTCFLLNAVTTHLTLDILPLPLLWAVLLALFLLSYVLGFSDGIARKLPFYGWGAVVCIGALAWALQTATGGAIYLVNLLAGCGLVFCACTFLHGWLYLMRPAASRLTRFYLLNAVGGAVGGVLTGLVAPLVFKSVAEYPIALVLAAMLCAGGMVALGRATTRGRICAGAYAVLAVACLVGLAVRLCLEDTKGRTYLYRDRGFFGTVAVTSVPAQSNGAKGELHEYIHGTTVHGIQVCIPGKERMPTAYHTANGGGLAITQHPKYKAGQPMRVCIVGMGVGVSVTYGRTNDYYRCYEISPQAVKIATDPKLFTFISDSPAKVDIACMDARKGLEAELAAGAEKYDVIQIDAFTGDNLPYHLSTVEAFILYFSMLKDDGMLAVNISNWHLDEKPLMRAIADTFHAPAIVFSVPDDSAHMGFYCEWAIFMKQDPKDFVFPPNNRCVDLRRIRRFPLPYDEKGSFMDLINW